MTITLTALTGHTLTVERIVDVPELEGTRIRREAETNTFSGPTWVIVERRDGQFIADHATDTSRPPFQSPYLHMWDAARDLADMLSWRKGTFEDLRYVGPAGEGDWQAAYVQEGWHVRLTARGPWQRVAKVVRHVNLATLRRTGQIRYRQVTLVLEDGKSVTRGNAAYLDARPFCA
jgi:hypothetical protein